MEFVAVSYGYLNNYPALQKNFAFWLNKEHDAFSIQQLIERRKFGPQAVMC